MSADYSLVYHEQAMERILAMRPSKRGAFLTELENIRHKLERASVGDFASRECPKNFIFSTARLEVTYRIDHAVKTVEIVAIENA